MHRSTQQGQSLTEFSVLALVLVPILMYAGTVGKVGDLNQNVMQGARYGAWEKAMVPNTVKNDPQISVEIQNRLMGNANTLIRSEDPLITSKDHQNPMWRSYGAHSSVDQRLFTAGAGDLKMVSNESGVPGVGPGALTAAITSVTGVIGDLSGGNFDVEEDGLYTATVLVNIRPDKYLEGTAELKDCDGGIAYVFTCVRRSNAILADTWAAHSPAQVESRVRAFVPMGAFDDFASVISKISVIPLFDEMKHLEDAPGYVAPDVIPEDRLGSYVE